jgi:hypothetical protein
MENTMMQINDCRLCAEKSATKSDHRGDYKVYPICKKHWQWLTEDNGIFYIVPEPWLLSIYGNVVYGCIDFTAKTEEVSV